VSALVGALWGALWWGRFSRDIFGERFGGGALVGALW